MSCVVCRTAPKREYGESSGKVFDDMKISPIYGARKLAALLIRNEIARLNLEKAQGRMKLSIHETGPGMKLATPGYYANLEIEELGRIAEALEARMPDA